MNLNNSIKNYTFIRLRRKGRGHRHYFADDLFSYIYVLEENKVPYHIVGHSHGGSLIWFMLNTSIRYKSNNLTFPFRKIESSHQLKYLKSWTTVGTPFVVDKQNRNHLKWAILTMLFFVGFAIFTHAAITDATKKQGFSLELIIFLLPIFFIVLPYLGKSLEYLQLYSESKAEKYIKEFYGSRWFGILSKYDEALIGLRAANNFKFSKNKKIQSKKNKMKPKYISHYEFFISKWLINALFKFIITPVVKHISINYFKSVALGNDRPGQFYYNIKDNPFDGNQYNLQKLDDKIEMELLKSADTAIKGKSIIVRKLIASSQSFENLTSFINSDSLTGDELIHTSYFNNENITQMIANNIKKSSKKVL